MHHFMWCTVMEVKLHAFLFSAKNIGNLVGKNLCHLDTIRVGALGLHSNCLQQCDMDTFSFVWPLNFSMNKVMYHFTNGQLSWYSD
jgi:hypothetical protein